MYLYQRNQRVVRYRSRAHLAYKSSIASELCNANSNISRCTPRSFLKCRGIRQWQSSNRWYKVNQHLTEADHFLMLTSGCSISQLQQRKSRRGVKQVNTKPWIHAVIFRQNGNFNRKPWPAKTQLLSSANTLITTLILLVLQNTTTVCFQRMLGNRKSHFKNCHPRFAVSINTSRMILVLLYTDQTNRIHTSKHRTRQKTCTTSKQRRPQDLQITPARLHDAIAQKAKHTTKPKRAWSACRIQQANDDLSRCVHN